MGHINLRLCFFKNASLYFLRISIAWDISISLKVVNIAFVFCASLSRCAILCLILFIFTLVSVRDPITRTGASLTTFTSLDILGTFTSIFEACDGGGGCEGETAVLEMSFSGASCIGAAATGGTVGDEVLDSGGETSAAVADPVVFILTRSSPL